MSRHLAIWIMVALGVAVRVLAARGDLWLDEIWSLHLARQAGTAAGVFTLHHDNNHYLNTLWMLWLGDGQPALWYRLPAVVAGAALLAAIARFEGPVALVLFAASDILVQYSSEARGYGPAVLFAVLAYQAFAAWTRSRSRFAAIAFALASILGLLSHASFVFALAGFAAWGITDARRTPMVLVPLVAPLAALAIVWGLDLRVMNLGGGPEAHVGQVLRELVRATIAAPRGWPELLGIVAIVAAGAELARAKERAFFVTTLLIAPALIVALRPPQYLAPRYFLVCVPFFLLLLARAIRRLPPAACAAVLALYCVLNALAIAGLVRDGRGSYRSAIAFMEENTPDGVVTVASDHDFRNRVCLEYHASQMQLPKPVVYVPGNGPARWYVRHDFSEAPDPPQSIVGPGGQRYFMLRTVPFSGLSGFNWHLYRAP
jgi:hypothetical protein